MNKTILKHLMVLPFLFGLLLFTACQEEGIEILTEPEEELLVANSTVAVLMQRTATLDGSRDNIIDNASCTEVVLPVTVFVNGLEIIIDSEDDFEVIEEIFDQLEDDEDSIDFVFPIKIILSNHEEITIANEDELNALISQCGGENEEDDDIECIDFVYPLTYVVFDTENSETRTVVINNDRDMFFFLKEIDENDIISLNFPVSLIYSNGEEISVENLEQLEVALDGAIDFCDEDDDNDYCDDDFDLERLNELLVICPWIVHDVHRDNENLTEIYREFVLVFHEDGTVKAKRRNGEIVSGTWETYETDRGVKLALTIEEENVFTLEWYVAELGYGRIKLHSEDGNRIVMHKNCDIVFDFTQERIEEILMDCLWRVHRLHIDGVDNEVDYYGTPLKFEEDGVVKLRINGEFVTGTWEVFEMNSGFGLTIEIENRPHLNLEWRIKILEDHFIALMNENSELILKKHCPNDDNDFAYVYDVLTEGLWEVAYYEEDQVDETEYFLEYSLDFKEMGGILVSRDNQYFSGSWLAYRYDGLLKLALNFGAHDPFFELNNRWKILDISPQRIELIDYGNNGAIEKKLVLELY